MLKSEVRGTIMTNSWRSIHPRKIQALRICSEKNIVGDRLINMSQINMTDRYISSSDV